MMRYAELYGNIKKPSVDYKESKVYDTEEAYKLLQCLESETEVPHWQIIVKLAVTTGMPRSEFVWIRI